MQKAKKQKCAQTPKPARKLTPLRGKMELDALQWLYENTGLSQEAYTKQKAAILARLEP